MMILRLPLIINYLQRLKRRLANENTDASFDVIAVDISHPSTDSRGTSRIIEASGASLMFLPPYSPDYNPIEHDFANIKRHQQYHSEKAIEDIIQMYQ